MYLTAAISGIITISFASYRLSQNQFGQEIKRLVIVRNVIDLVGFLIMNLFTYVSFWLYRADPKKNHDDNFTLRTLQWLFYGQGFLLVLPRLFEPAFFKIIWFKFRQGCGKTKKETNID